MFIISDYSFKLCVTTLNYFQIYNMATGLIEKELALHNHPVRFVLIWNFLTFNYINGR